jgi:hypothetical protein
MKAQLISQKQLGKHMKKLSKDDLIHIINVANKDSWEYFLAHSYLDVLVLREREKNQRNQDFYEMDKLQVEANDNDVWDQQQNNEKQQWEEENGN